MIGFITNILLTYQTTGSNNGYKWQPISDLDWIRSFDKMYLNKRMNLSHSESHALFSNEGKPKPCKRSNKTKKGAGKRARRAQPKRIDAQQANETHVNHPVILSRKEEP